MEGSKPYTLITGASHGIGKAFANLFAERGHNLFLIALPDKLLEETSDYIKDNYKVEVISFGIDLTTENAARAIHDYAEQRDIKINILINNAGLGSGGLFEHSDMDLNRYILRLNNQVMVELIRLFVKDLIELSPSYILNMSSMEATLPLPYKSVYTATKNFIYSFSLALSEELKPRRVHVAVVCPGAVLTNEDGLKRIQSMGWRAKLLLKMPEDVAKIAIKGLFNGKRVIIPGFIPLFIIRVMHFFPVRLKMKILEKIFRNYKDHQPIRLENTRMKEFS